MSRSFVQTLTATMILMSALGGGCGAGGIQGPSLSVSPPHRLCRNRSLGPQSFCLPAVRVERLLRHGELHVLEVRNTFGGTTNPVVLQLSYRVGGTRLVLLAKWKPAPRGSADGLNNNPRRELAAYEIQKLFLKPADYVVPPTVARCLPLRLARQIQGSAEPTFPGSNCVLGVLSYWLQGVTQRRVYNLKRFHRDRPYRWHMANFNLFTYLIEHRDSRFANHVIAKDRLRPRVFAVDNGLAFGSFLKNPVALFTVDWSTIFVPALARQSVAKLRGLSLSRLQRRLSTVAEFRLRRGRLAPVAPVFAGPTAAVFADGAQSSSSA